MVSEVSLDWGSRWMYDNLPGPDNALWRWGKKRLDGPSSPLVRLGVEAMQADLAAWWDKLHGDPGRWTWGGAMAPGLAEGMRWALEAAAQLRIAPEDRRALHDHLVNAACAYERAWSGADRGYSGTVATELADPAEVATRVLGHLEGAWGEGSVGAAMARSALAELVPDILPPRTHGVSLPTLFVQGRRGEVKILTLEWFRRPGAYRAWFFPDPVGLGCTTLDPAFRAGLDAAWAYARGRFPGGWIRWRLAAFPDPGQRDVLLTGGSAGAAFAAGLCILAERACPDRGVGLTATVDSRGKLGPVISVGNKAETASRSCITRLVVHSEDAARLEHLPAVIPNLQSLIPAWTVEEAINHLTGEVKAVLDFLDRLAGAVLRDLMVVKPPWVNDPVVERPEELCIPPRVLTRDQRLRLPGQAGDDRPPAGQRDDVYDANITELFALSMDGDGWAAPRGFAVDGRPPAKLLDVLPLDGLRRGGRPGVIIWGEPGEGKSTALAIYVATRCRRLRAAISAQQATLNGPELVVPLVLPLGSAPFGNEDVTTVAMRYTLDLAYGRGSSDLVSDHAKGAGFVSGGEELVRRWLERRRQAKGYELVLDSCDEMLAAGGGAAFVWLRRGLADGEVAWLISARTTLSIPPDASGRTALNPEGIMPDAQAYWMVSFEWQDVRDYVKRFFASDPGRAKEVIGRVFQNPGPRQYAQLPIGLALLCEAVLRKDKPFEVPKTKTEFLEMGLRRLLGRGEERRRKRIPKWPEENDRRDRWKEQVLKEIAWRHFANGPRRIDRDALLNFLADQLSLWPPGLHPPESAEALLGEFHKDDGILVPAGVDQRDIPQYRFALRSFHEYLVAGWLARPDSPLRRVPGRMVARKLAGRGRSWSRPEWAFRPIDAPEWRHVWPLVVGHLWAQARDLLLKDNDAKDRPEAPARVEPREPADRRCYRRVMRLIDVILDTSWRRWQAQPEELAGLVAEAPPGRCRARERYVRHLRMLLEAPHPWPLDVGHSLHSLIRIGEPQTREYLEKQLYRDNAGDPDTRRFHEALWKFPVFPAIVLPAILINTVRFLRGEDTELVPFDVWLERKLYWWSGGLLAVSSGAPRYVYEMSALALGNLGDPASIPALQDVLESRREDPTIRSACARSLGKLGGNSAREVLLGLIKDRAADREVRGACAHALVRLEGGEARTTLADRVRDKTDDPAFRETCIRALRDIPDGSLVGVMMERLQDRTEQSGLREASVYGLADIDHASAITSLAALIDQHDEDFGLCEKVARKLGGLGGDRARDSLIARLEEGPGRPSDRGSASDTRSPDEHDGRGSRAGARRVRVACVGALASIADLAARECLVRRYFDVAEDAAVRAAAAEALKTLGYPAAPEALRPGSALFELLDKLESDLSGEDTSVSRGAEYTDHEIDPPGCEGGIHLLRHEGCVDPIRRLLGWDLERVILQLESREGDVWTRQVAVWMVGRAGCAEGYEVLARRMGDDGEDLVIRLSCVRALRHRGDPSTTVPLLELYRDRAADFRVRVACLEELGRGGEAPPFDDLRSVLADSSEVLAVRCESVRAMGRIGRPAATKELVHWLCHCEDEEPRAVSMIRGACAEALGLADEADAAGLLMEILADRSEDPAVRSAAAFALGRIGGERARRALAAQSHAAGDESMVRIACMMALEEAKPR